MQRRVIGALLLFFLGAAGIVGVWYVLPLLKEAQQKVATDAEHVRGRITVDLDNWVGYFMLRSPLMKKEMHRAGWQLVPRDDNADYAQRMKRLREGSTEFAVATVDSFLVGSASAEPPGAIIMVVDESKGGDAIVARRERVSTLNELKDRPNISVAFTPDSPSHYLLKAASHHFNVPELLPPSGPLRIATKGSSEALTRLLAGKTDIAVLWEPDVSRALSHEGIVKLLGTEDTEKLIVDILVVNRKFAERNGDAVKLLLSTYFRVLKSYRDRPDLLRADVAVDAGVPESSVDTMLKGVRWVNLTDNCEKWFGIAGPGSSGDDGLITTIDSTINTLINAGDFSSNPLPGGDPYRLINSSYLADIFVKGVSGIVTPRKGPGTSDAGTSLAGRFSALDDGAWSQLKEVGSLKIDPIVFQSGSSTIDFLAKQVIDESVDLLKHYPNFRVLIRGHTGTTGDADRNQELSRERAEAVARYLEVTYAIDPNRLRAVGLGGSAPLQRRSDESLRAWEYRLPRVELVLVREDF
jgi:outer membrane protein OmpA-like peptidoglycan-associated protein